MRRTYYILLRVDTEFHVTRSDDVGGAFDVFTTTTVNIDTASFDVDAETVASITSATTTINGSTASNIRGATVGINGTTVDIDATTYNLNATSSNLVTVSPLGIVPHLTDPSITSPGSASVTDPTEPEEEDPIEVILPEILHLNLSHHSLRVLVKMTHREKMQMVIL